MAKNVNTVNTANTANKQTSFIAHQRASDGDEQSVETHLLEVADLARRFAEKIGLAQQGELIGLLHDLGKYSSAFQNYLKSAINLLNPDDDAEFVDAKGLKGKIDHSSAGAQLIWQTLSHRDRWGGISGQILALCVASHHSGLIDCLSANIEQFGSDMFAKRIKKGDERTHLQEACAKMDPSIGKRFAELIESSTISDGIKQAIRLIVRKEAKGDEQIIRFKVGLLVRCLFSCLIDADRISSADFEKPRAAKSRPSGHYAEWGRLIDLLEAKLSTFVAAPGINNLRASIADHCKDKADGARGVYTLSVPTGGGKTLASLRFALHHAQQHQLDRIIYAIPFTSIIDQNARVVREILEPNGVEAGSVVLENHSNLLPEEQNWKTKMLSDNWDAPVIYTTNVQVLEVLFGSGTRGARRMHQLANSVIIFDEIQTLPIKCIHMFCNAVNFLVEQCRATVVLCTATQPLINLVEKSKGALRIPPENEIMPDVAALFRDLKRVEVVNSTRPGGWSSQDVCALALAEVKIARSCLVIVNTKKVAQALFALGKAEAQADFPVFHLSTNMCPAHRKAILKVICQRLKDREPLLCISTQLVEAGVDVDFGTVIRSVAGLDSIAQAAGRCNRNGARAVGSVYVVNLPEECVDMLPDIVCGQGVTKKLLSDFENDPGRFDQDLIGPKAIAYYFREYFAKRPSEMDYPVAADSPLGRDDTLLNLLSANSLASDRHEGICGHPPEHYLRQSFMAAAKAFKAIDAPTRGVIVPYGKAGEELINELKSAYLVEKQFDLLRHAQQFTVNVFPGDLRKLQELGAVREVQRDIDILYLDNLYYYEDFGLGLTAQAMGVYCV